MLNCTLEKTPGGWYLTFPRNVKAGLLLSEPEEQIKFLTDCGIHGGDTDLDRIFRMFKIHQCSFAWYLKACTPGEPF